MTGSVDTKATIEIDAELMRSGKLQGLDFELYLAIVSHMGKDGKAYPTQKRLGEMLNVGDRTIRRRLDKLLQFKVDGRPVLAKEIKTRGGSNVYKMPYTRDTSTGKYNSRNVLDYFGKLYEEKYGEAYVFNYGRDGKIAKDKLVDQFDPDTIEQVFDFIFQHYEVKWGNKQYPRPTFVACTGWLFNTALGQMPKKVKTEVDIDSNKYYDNAEDLF